VISIMISVMQKKGIDRAALSIGPTYEPNLSHFLGLQGVGYASAPVNKTPPQSKAVSLLKMRLKLLIL